MKISPTIVHWFYVTALYLISGNTIISFVLGGLIVYSFLNNLFWIFICSGAAISFLLLINRWSILKNKQLMIEELEQAQKLADEYSDDED